MKRASRAGSPPGAGRYLPRRSAFAKEFGKPSKSCSYWSAIASNFSRKEYSTGFSSTWTSTWLSPRWSDPNSPLFPASPVSRLRTFVAAMSGLPRYCALTGRSGRRVSASERAGLRAERVAASEHQRTSRLRAERVAARATKGRSRSARGALEPLARRRIGPVQLRVRPADMISGPLHGAEVAERAPLGLEHRDAPVGGAEGVGRSAGEGPLRHRTTQWSTEFST